MPDGSITKLLAEVKEKAPGAEDRLFRRVYDELLAMARARIARESPDVAGSPTDLVHDAFARLHDARFGNRRHLFFAYARAMRQILIEVARRRRARGVAQPLDPDAVAPKPNLNTLDAIDLDARLEALAARHPRAAEVVELRFFGGLSDGDIGEVLGIDERTVRRDWALARSVLGATDTSAE